ncbi:hypothetical protein [Frankia sp. CiP1_Cm_nod1]
MLICSAMTGAGLEEVWRTVERHRETLAAPAVWRPAGAASRSPGRGR